MVTDFTLMPDHFNLLSGGVLGRLRCQWVKETSSQTNSSIQKNALAKKLNAYPWKVTLIPKAQPP